MIYFYNSSCRCYFCSHQGRSTLYYASQDSLRSNERTSSSARLKNNRLVVDGNGNEDQKNEYYPYGGPWGDASTNQSFQPFKYNGKELDRVHGLDWYDYGARRYDPAYCMFTQIDPLAEKYPHLNPYVYCAGNPVRYVDPDGMDWYENEEGKWYGLIILAKKVLMTIIFPENIWVM